MRYFFPMIIFGCLLFFLWRGLSQDPTLIASPLINKHIPVFTAASVDNTTQVITEKIFFGHTSLLVVWSSWCSHCLLEQMLLLDLQKNVEIPFIGLNYRDHLLSARNWLRRYGNPYHQVIFDPKGLLAIHLGVYGVPETFLVDHEGIIRYKHVGPLSRTEWDAEVMPLLDVKKVRKHG